MKIETRVPVKAKTTRRWLSGVGLLILLFAACTGEISSLSPSASGYPNGSPDPYMACTDKTKCCTPDNTLCWGDPDKGTLCKCTGIWECPASPAKCEQEMPTPPGSGSWTCTWSPAVYTCKGTTKSPPEGGGGWGCAFSSTENLWICNHTAPNPTNTPGAGGWRCTVDNELDKLVCEKSATTLPDAGGAAPREAGASPITPPPPSTPKTETNCTDGIDNDGDGLVDCLDPDCPCSTTPTPPPPAKHETKCADGIDNDGDGLVDCLDPDCPPCSAPPPPSQKEANCYDGIDNDGDWLVDCLDPDCPPCWLPPPPSSTETKCYDGIDNDGDGLVDCEDPDCPPCSQPPPSQKETNCADGIDNDGDGLVDCLDPDCPACSPPTPLCPSGDECCDGVDNNGDGRIDEGNVCAGVGEPCPPGAFQSCDCYCGVHRKCRPDGTWGPCKVDGGSYNCKIATVTSHDQCPAGEICDFGICVGLQFANDCHHHSDCTFGLICDGGRCKPDPYDPQQCP
jgi:hypothetical protein